jgi:2-oxoglutarate dehydrogenase E1 component
MLLPHGYEGQGPEHSSARLERFLTLCARNNLRVTMPSSAAQYFHLLRAQTSRAHLTPLIVMTPKSLLRAESTRSAVSEFEAGSFKPVLADDDCDAAKVRRVVLCSGKVAHEALQRRTSLREAGSAAADEIAIIRMEQLYPWPDAELEGVLAGVSAAEEILWLQEEPENMGAWPFAHHQLHRVMRDRLTLRHVARAESASPATGSGLVHQAEQADLLDRAIGER